MAGADFSIGAPGRPEVEREPAAAEPLDVEGVALDGPEPPMVDAAVVRAVLSAAGGLAETLIGDDDVEGHWRFTDQELDDLAPAVTRIANRRPALRRAIMRGDEVAVILTLAGYVGRNIADGQAAKEERGELDREADGAAGRAGTATARAAGNGDRSAGWGRWSRPDHGGGAEGGGTDRASEGGGVG